MFNNYLVFPRFSFCAVACLSLLDRLDSVDLEKAVEFVCSCMNFDGGFGTRPGSESHAGQVQFCVGSCIEREYGFPSLFAIDLEFEDKKSIFD